MNIEEYEITKHIKERYAERIMQKDNNNDLNLFIVQNEDKIKTDILKMMEFGEIIFSGKSSTMANRNPVDVYLCGLWIIIADQRNKTLVTMYKIDLGIGEDFNKEYVNKYIEKINAAKEEFNNNFESNKKLCNNYRDIISQNESIINEYKGYIKSLEEQNNGYKLAIDNMQVNNSICEKNVSQLVAKLIGKKEF